MRSRRSKVQFASSAALAATAALVLFSMNAGGDARFGRTSEAEARNAVHRFVGRDLPLTTDGVKRGVPNDGWSFSGGGYTFLVDAKDAEVLIASMPAEKRLAAPVERPAALESGERFAASRYRGFGEMRLEADSYVDHGEGIQKEFRFTWRQYVGDAMGPSLVSVGVDAASGDVVSYVARRVRVQIEDTTPKVSRERAVAVAIDKAAYVPTESSAQLEVWVDPNSLRQHLAWRVRLDGLRPVDGFPVEKVALPGNYELILDASTEDVLNIASG